MFNVAYHLLLESCRTTEEEAEAQERVEKKLRDMEIQQATGMVPIPWARPADEMYPRG